MWQKDDVRLRNEVLIAWFIILVNVCVSPCRSVCWVTKCSALSENLFYKLGKAPRQLFLAEFTACSKGRIYLQQLNKGMVSSTRENDQIV